MMAATPLLSRPPATQLPAAGHASVRTPKLANFAGFDHVLPDWVTKKEENPEEIPDDTAIPASTHLPAAGQATAVGSAIPDALTAGPTFWAFCQIPWVSMTTRAC